jgi:P4 family phage/plasmid primase-like protien
MQNEIKKYTKEKLVCFSIDVKQKKHKNGNYKKDIDFPSKWTDFTLNKTYVNNDYNGISLLTGKINKLIVIDIDNVVHWEKLLEENKEEDPDTVKVISGSGGIHFYFQYDKDLEEVKSKDHCFGKDYDIDIKTNGGCVIAPPTKYYNENLKKEVEYKWEKSIFEHKPSKMPKWIKNLLLEKKVEKQKLKKETNKDENIGTLINQSVSFLNETSPLAANVTGDVNEDSELNFTINDIECIIDMLNESRNNSYNDWLSVGMCLYNINPKYLLLWEKWSQQSEKYEEGNCEEKWDSFKKNKDGLKIGSLLLWAKSDNPQKYEDFMKKKKMNKIILSKYPNEKLVLGDRQELGDKNYYIHLKNKECFIKGSEHIDMPNSMYIDILDKFMTIKCRHPECFGKKYPCNHILMNKNEMNIAFNGDVTININNGNDDEFVDFQQIDIYDDPKLNELVYNSLNGKSLPLAEIIYYYYENEYMYGEDENWYVYKNHKWKNLGKKNNDLRFNVQPKLKSLYKELCMYYKENDYDKQKIKSLKNTMSMFDDVNLKNNIMTELIDIYTVKKNSNRDFIQKLDSNNHLIGFNNGVFDLDTFKFREGNCNDYITMSVGYDYSDKHTEKYIDLFKFLEDIQPNKEEREYMLTYLSIGLIGNQLELFTILTGCGRNGKSKLVELLKCTLGDYFGSVQSQLFTRSRPDANSPDPGLLSLMKKKIVIASEPEKNAKLNSGFIKFITGRDSTTLRNCHSNDMIDFTAKFITLLICNDIPDCDDIDNAFSKRLRCVNFPTEFVMEPKLQNQKKLDVNINKNFDYWKLDFMLLLLDYYKKYKETHELKPTENILKWTNQYKEDTDLYLQFLNECTEEGEVHSHTSDLYESFKLWFKINNPNSKTPSNKEFINNIKKYKNVERFYFNQKQRFGIKNLKIINLVQNEEN